MKLPIADNTDRKASRKWGDVSWWSRAGYTVKLLYWNQGPAILNSGTLYHLHAWSSQGCEHDLRMIGNFSKILELFKDPEWVIVHAIEVF